MNPALAAFLIAVVPAAVFTILWSASNRADQPIHNDVRSDGWEDLW